MTTAASGSVKNSKSVVPVRVHELDHERKGGEKPSCMDKQLFGEHCDEECEDWSIDPIYDVPIQDLWRGWYFVAGSPYTYTFNTAAGFVNNLNHHR